jgi:hypothetical protein
LKNKKEEQETKDAREHQRKREATEKALQGDNRKGKVSLCCSMYLPCVFLRPLYTCALCPVLFSLCFLPCARLYSTGMFAYVSAFAGGHTVPKAKSLYLNYCGTDTIVYIDMCALILI